MVTMNNTAWRKTLFQMSASEAQDLSIEYRKRLDKAQIFQPNETQKRIANCLSFYYSCLHWQHVYNASSQYIVRFAAKETMIKFAPIVRRDRHLVDQWLAAGMPLDMEENQ